LAGQVLLKIACLLMRWLSGLAVLVSRGDGEKGRRVAVLRHENAVLRRNAGRVQYEPADRACFAALTWFISRPRWAEVFPVTPATLLAWHRRLAARKYDTSKRRRPGRPPTIRGIARLAVRLAHENPLWGYRRIHGGLTKLGVMVAACAVHEIVRSAVSTPRRQGAVRPGGSSCTRRPPGSWRSMSCTWTVALTRLYVLVFIEHGARRMHIGGVDGAAGPQPCPGPRRAVYRLPVPDPRPRPGLHPLLRRRLPGHRHHHRAHRGAGTADERPLRTSIGTLRRELPGRP
jgi:hypothetical protein